LVIKPNKGLAFTHKKKFCKYASKVDAKKFSSDPGIWYCTFSEFFDIITEEEQSLPYDMVVFIDEAPDFFK